MTERHAADDTPKHTVILDWDGTLVPAEWPGQPTEFMPGAVEAVFRLHRAGLKLMVCSARLNPYDPWTMRQREPYEVEAEHQYIRSTLDSKGLTFVDIWRLMGKPSGSAYVDDKGYRYTGRPGSWKAMADKLLVALTDDTAIFPPFDQEEAEKQ